MLRYIHLNPIRAGMVKSLIELAGYAWCGHGCVMGRRKYDWQDRDYVLRWFGKVKQEAMATYSRYMKDGVSQGERPELVGGGLIRSLGRWGGVSSHRREKKRKIGDERILGDSGFAERVMKDGEERVKHQLSSNRLREKILDVMQTTCKQEGVEIEELRFGSRRGKLPKLRLKIASRLTREYGVALAEIGRQLGITTSAVSKMLTRNEASLSR